MYFQKQVGYLLWRYSVIESRIGMNVMVLVLSEGFYHTMKVNHLQKEVHYPSWGMNQSNSAYIRERIDIYLL